MPFLLARSARPTRLRAAERAARSVIGSRRSRHRVPRPGPRLADRRSIAPSSHHGAGNQSARGTEDARSLLSARPLGRPLQLPSSMRASRRSIGPARRGADRRRRTARTARLRPTASTRVTVVTAARFADPPQRRLGLRRDALGAASATGLHPVSTVDRHRRQWRARTSRSRPAPRTRESIGRKGVTRPDAFPDRPRSLPLAPSSQTGATETRAAFRGALLIDPSTRRRSKYMGYMLAERAASSTKRSSAGRPAISTRSPVLPRRRLGLLQARIVRPAKTYLLGPRTSCSATR